MAALVALAASPAIAADFRSTTEAATVWYDAPSTKAKRLYVVGRGYPLMRAHFPRCYVDVNREPYELDPRMFDGRLPSFANTRSMRVAGGLGTVARVVGDAQEIYDQRISVDDALRRLRLHQHGQAMTVIVLPDLGHREAARRALDQAHAQSLLEQCDASAQLRLWHADGAGGRREAAMVDDLDEIIEVVQVLHRPTDRTQHLLSQSFWPIVR